jgi:hypothetical protein
VNRAAKLRRAEHQLPGHDSVANDLAVAVDVLEERVQRPDPLYQAALDQLPLVGRDDPRHQVERERPVDARAVGARDLEGDPLLGEDLVAAAAEVGELEPADQVEAGEQGSRVLARLARLGEQLVSKPGQGGVVAGLADERGRHATQAMPVRGMFKSTCVERPAARPRHLVEARFPGA